MDLNPDLIFPGCFKEKMSQANCSQDLIKAYLRMLSQASLNIVSARLDVS